MCKQKGAPGFRTIEVETTAAVDYTLPDDEILRKAKRIIGLVSYKVGTLALSSTGRPVVNDTVFNKSYLTIITADDRKVLVELPLSDLNRAANSGEIFYVDIPPIAPSKCEIHVGSPAALVTTESFVIGFLYEP